jgi:hypothetical protein
MVPACIPQIVSISLNQAVIGVQWAFIPIFVVLILTIRCFCYWLATIGLRFKVLIHVFLIEVN